MINPVTTLLVRALAYFEEHSGAVGQFNKDNGTVCALGALNMVTTHIPSQNSRSTTYCRAAELLDAAATDMGRKHFPHRDSTPVTVINDTLGAEAVRVCYRNAIDRALLEELPQQ